jgi:hypothetical protein
MTPVTSSAGTVHQRHERVFRSQSHDTYRLLADVTQWASDVGDAAERLPMPPPVAAEAGEDADLHGFSRAWFDDRSHHAHLVGSSPATAERRVAGRPWWCGVAGDLVLGRVERLGNQPPHVPAADCVDGAAVMSARGDHSGQPKLGRRPYAEATDRGYAAVTQVDG